MFTWNVRRCRCIEDQEQSNISFSRIYKIWYNLIKFLGVGEDLEVYVGAAWNNMHCFLIYEEISVKA